MVVDARLFAMAMATVIIAVSLVSVTLRPDSWPQIVAIAMPTLTMLGAWIKIDGQVQEYHVLVNSRMDELLSVNRRAARAEGNIEGQAMARQEPPAAAAAVVPTVLIMPTATTAPSPPIGEAPTEEAARRAITVERLGHERREEGKL